MIFTIYFLLEYLNLFLNMRSFNGTLRCIERTGSISMKCGIFLNPLFPRFKALFALGWSQFSAQKKIPQFLYSHEGIIFTAFSGFRICMVCINSSYSRRNATLLKTNYCLLIRIFYTEFFYCWLNFFKIMFDW